MQMPKYAEYLVYLLPMLHLAAFLGGWLGHDFANLLFVDAPFSALFMGLDYKGVNPIISWGILGTLWWYLISRFIRWIVIGMGTGVWDH
jgi:hypothetical protein